MLKKFRRSCKANVETSPSTQRTSNSVATTATRAKSRTTFFSLPPEIRNDIYTLIGNDVRLSLVCDNKAKVHKRLSSMPGLLAACKQCRAEYLAILLSIAPVTARVVDFDFRTLQRVVGSLYSTELKALRVNRRLTIQLRLRKCNDDALSNLRRWCVSRASSLDRLPWCYALGETAPLARLAWFAQRVRVLYDNVEGECEKWEVRQVLDVLNVELEYSGKG